MLYESTFEGTKVLSYFRTFVRDLYEYTYSTCTRTVRVHVQRVTVKYCFPRMDSSVFLYTRKIRYTQYNLYLRTVHLLSVPYVYSVITFEGLYQYVYT